MSPEGDSGWAKIARGRYANLTQWEEQRSQILKDFQKVLSIRKRLSSKDSRKAGREVTSILTKSDIAIISPAILYSDIEDPKLVTAWNSNNNHSDVVEQAKYEYSDLVDKPMIFGEEVILKDNTILFVCDSIMLSNNTIELPTRRNYIEVANILLDLGCIPVDAEFRILPITY